MTVSTTRGNSLLLWKPSKCCRGTRMRPRSRWFPPPALMLLLLMLLLIVLSLHPRLSYGLHARCCSRLLKWHTPTMSCWKKLLLSRGLPRKQARQGLSNDARRPLLHTYTCTLTCRVTPHYILFVIYTHIHTYIQREGRVLSFGVALCL